MWRDLRGLREGSIRANGGGGIHCGGGMKGWWMSMSMLGSSGAQ